MGLTGAKGNQGDIGPTGIQGPTGTCDCPQTISFFPTPLLQICGIGLDWDGVEELEGTNKTGDTYFVGVNIPNSSNYTVTSAVNSFTQTTAEYTYSGTTSLTLSNFNVVAVLNGKTSNVVDILNGKLSIEDAVGYTYYLLINGVVKSTIVLNGSVTPQSGNNTATFTINPNDKIVIKAVLNPGAKNEDHPDDFTFEWCANYA
jgi:hypothetical protein